MTHTNRRLRPQFTIGFLLWLLCVVAIGFSVYNRWIAKDYRQRSRESEMVARENGVQFIDVWVDYYGVLPRFDDDGNVNLHECRPYVDLTDPALGHDGIERLLPYLRGLLPDEGKFRVAVFLSGETFSDTDFVTRLREKLPRCEVFNRTQFPGYFHSMKP